MSTLYIVVIYKWLWLPHYCENKDVFNFIISFVKGNFVGGGHARNFVKIVMVFKDVA